MPGGRVGIIVDGSTPNTDLTINPLGEPQEKGFAKSFAYGESGRNHLLNIGQITVTSGEIGDIEGYQDAELSGPIQIAGNSAIDRIALDAILPGASITTGGDLETLDVLNGIDLSGSGTGITIGRDLNLLNVGGSITLSNGANFQIDRDLGLVSPAAQGDRDRLQRPVAQFHQRHEFASSPCRFPRSAASSRAGSPSTPAACSPSAGISTTRCTPQGTINGYSRLFINYGLSSQANPPFIQSLAIASSVPASTTGPAPTGYVTAIGGVIP